MLAAAIDWTAIAVACIAAFFSMVSAVGVAVVNRRLRIPSGGRYGPFPRSDEVTVGQVVEQARDLSAASAAASAANSAHLEKVQRTLNNGGHDEGKAAS